MNMLHTPLESFATQPLHCKLSSNQTFEKKKKKKKVHHKAFLSFFETLCQITKIWLRRRLQQVRTLSKKRALCKGMVAPLCKWSFSGLSWRLLQEAGIVYIFEWRQSLIQFDYRFQQTFNWNCQQQCTCLWERRTHHCQTCLCTWLSNTSRLRSWRPRQCVLLSSPRDPSQRLARGFCTSLAVGHTFGSLCFRQRGWVFQQLWSKARFHYIWYSLWPTIRS